MSDESDVGGRLAEDVAVQIDCQNAGWLWWSCTPFDRERRCVCVLVDEGVMKEAQDGS